MATYVSSVMTKNLITVPIEATVQQTLDLMNSRRIRHLPVVDGDRAIVGIVSENSLRLHSPQTSVSQAMTKDFSSVPETLPLRSAILKMLEKRNSCLLIENEFREAVGIITTDDLLWTLAHLLQDERGTSLKGLINIQTIGAVANQLSTMGI